MNIKTVFSLTAAIIAGSLMFTAPASAGKRCSQMHGIDSNHDSRLSKWEVASAANATFSRLNRDGDATLERDELRGRMGPRAFAAANRIKGRGIDRIEYMSYVKRLFRSINRDGDRTLECPELCTAAGTRLLRLLR